MSLRATYHSALDAQLIAGRDAGAAWIVSNLTAIQNAMAGFAASGKTSFTITLPVSYQPADLRLNGRLWAAFQTGIYSQLSSENIMKNEVTANLNLSDQLSTQIDLVFVF